MPRIREYNFARFASYCTARIRQDKPTLVAVDTETNGASFYADPFCVTMTWRAPNGALRNGYWELAGIDFAETKVREILDDVADREGSLVFHNAKFDLQKLVAWEMIDLGRFPPERVHDTEAIWHLLHPFDFKSLDFLTPNRLGLAKYEETIKSGNRKGETRLASASKKRMKEALKRAGLKAQDGYHLLPRSDVVAYAMDDTRYTYLLYELGYPKLTRGMLDAYAMEQEVTFALLDMEAGGLALDLDYLNATTSEFGVKIMESAATIRELAEDPNLNPASPDQLLKALEMRGHKVTSTDKKHLRKIDDDLAREILNYRYLTKVHGDKLRPLQDEQRDGIVHPWIRQHGTKTGRTASGSAQIDG